MSRVIVIGAGAIGATVACRLALGGAEVVLLEAGRPGGGTSGTSFAWANSHDKAPRAYHDLNLAGMRAHAALAAEFGASPWWHDGGCLEWSAPARQPAQRAKVEALLASDYRAQWLDARQALELEPDLSAEAIGDAPVAFYAEEGWVALVPYIQAMLAIAGRHGAVLHRQTAVAALLREGDRVTGIRTTGGEVIEGDCVVNCAGRWADLLEPAPGLALPLKPSHGYMLFTPPVATSLRRVIRTPECNMRPDGGGRLMLRRAELDLKVTPASVASADDEDARALIAHATQVLPAMAGAAGEAARVGTRPIPADGLPAVGALPGMGGYYVVVTHSGATLAPLLGRLAAGEILGGPAAPQLASFRPGRLLRQPA